MPHHFISHSNLEDAKNFAIRLHDALEGGTPPIACWLDLRDLIAGRNWDTQIQEGIRDCTTLLFIMTPDSVVDTSVCYEEWTLALKYKKIVIPIRFDPKADAPFRLHQRQWIDFSRDFDQGITQLRDYFRLLDSPRGRLIALQDRLRDAERDVRRTIDEIEKGRIEAEIVQLKEDIVRQEEIVNDPAAAEKRTAASIESRLELERQPARPITPSSRLKFINAPPASVPPYFQDRHVETKLVADFLKHPQQRLLTVVGRGGIGKTAMIVRVLKALERQELPNDLGKLDCNGIVYFSAVGNRRLNLPNLFEDLCKLLPSEQADEMQAIYKQPTLPTAQKMRALLAKLLAGRMVVLLDNFESLLNDANDITDGELDEALQAVLNAAPHGVKLIVTTRRAAQNLMLIQPQFQRRLDLDSGLESPFAENILREMDEDGVLGLKALSVDDPRLQTARERTRGYPRALEALFGILSADRSTTLPEILERAYHDTPLPENVVEVLVGEAFSHLDSLSQRVMQALAIYGRPVPPVAVDYLLQPFLSSVDSAPILQRLVNMHFARMEGGRFFLHAVDQAVILSSLAIGSPHLTKLRTFSSPVIALLKLVGRFFPPFIRWLLGTPQPLNFVQLSLYKRAADYYLKLRKDQAEWKNLDDIAPQLHEFELRCASGDFDRAGIVLLGIDEHLDRTGNNALVTAMTERLLDSVHDSRLKHLVVGDLGVALMNQGEVHRAIGYLMQAVEMSQAARDKSAERVALSNLGAAYQRIGRVQEALQLYEEALALAHRAGNRATQRHNLHNLGIAYKELGDISRSITFYDRALALAQDDEAKADKSHILTGLANAYRAKGEAAKALGYYEQALVIARELGDKEEESELLGGLGSAYADLGQVAEAMACHEQALATARAILKRRSEGNHLNNLGGLHHQQGEFRAAAGYYEQALAIAREVNDRDNEAGRLGNLALVYQKLGQVDNAMTCYTRTLKLARIAGNHEIEGKTLGNLGILSRREGRVREAIAYYEQALEVARAREDHRHVGVWLGNLGAAHVYIGQLEKAMDYFTQALAIARKLADRYGEGRHLINIGIVQAYLNQTDKALQSYTQALATNEAIRDQEGKAMALNNVALLYLDLNDIPRATEALETAMRIADTIELLTIRSYTRRGLALLHLLAGQLDEAHKFIVDALPHTTTENKHQILALQGIILIRQRDPQSARDAFTAAFHHANDLLSKTAENYEALDILGLAHSGLLICGAAPIEDTVLVADSINAFQAARKIIHAPGVVRRVLRLYDELKKADSMNVLNAEMRIAAGGE